MWREGLKRMLDTLRPWPSRSQRKSAIAAATAEREAAQQRAGHARQVSQSIEHIVYGDNHFASSIAEQIVRGHRHRNGGTGEARPG